jgi:hypothetical protein
LIEHTSLLQSERDADQKTLIKLEEKLSGSEIEKSSKSSEKQG